MEMTITEYRNFQKLEKQRLMGFTKGELIEELLAVYEHYRKLQNTSSNSDYAKCPDCGEVAVKVGNNNWVCGCNPDR